MLLVTFPGTKKALTFLSFQVYSTCVPIGCMSAPGAQTLIRGL